MSETILVEQEIEIEAPAEIVFELLTDAEGLRKWMAVEVQSDVVDGGLIRWRHENGAVMSGRFVEIERPTRVVFTYGWEEGGPAVPPGSTRVVIDLEEREGLTRLHLVHSEIPSSMVEDHRRGWEWFLGKLAERGAARRQAAAQEVLARAGLNQLQSSRGRDLRQLGAERGLVTASSGRSGPR